MTCNGNRFFPVRDEGNNSLYKDGGTEHCAIQNSADCSVGRLPHLMEIIFLHTGRVGSNSSAFHSHSIFFCGHSTVICYLVAGQIPVFQAKIIVFCFQIYVGRKKDILNHLPDNPGHFIPIHLNKGSGHSDFVCHIAYLRFVSPFWGYCSSLGLSRSALWCNSADHPQEPFLSDAGRESLLPECQYPL